VLQRCPHHCLARILKKTPFPPYFYSILAPFSAGFAQEIVALSASRDKNRNRPFVAGIRVSQNGR